jgi:hypothetical protein
MKGLELYLIPWLIANTAGLVILFTAYKWPKWGRILFSLLFGWACVQNYTTVHATPEVYMEYANLSVSFYSRFIEGWFSEHVTAVVTLISAGQGAIAVGFLLKGWWVKLAGIGAILFLFAIAPLGVGAGFPFSITVSLAAFFILQKNELNYIWEKWHWSTDNSQKSTS